MAAAFPISSNVSAHFVFCIRIIASKTTLSFWWTVDIPLLDQEIFNLMPNQIECACASGVPCVKCDFRLVELQNWFHPLKPRMNPVACLPETRTPGSPNQVTLFSAVDAPAGVRRSGYEDCLELFREDWLSHNLIITCLLSCYCIYMPA